MRSALWTNINGVVLMSFFGGLITSIITGAISRRQAKKDLAEQRAYDEGAMQRMRDAASKAGFNPLTALRMGALSSFNTPGRVLPPGGAAFAAQYLGDAIGEMVDKKANEPIEKYNAEIRRLEILQREADIKLSRATLGSLNKKEDKGPMSVPLYDSSGSKLVDGNGNTIYVPAEANEVIPKYKLVHDNKTGATYAIINPELTESGLSEMVTGLAMDAAGQAAAETGQGLSYKGWGFSADPFELNKGMRFPKASNLTLAKPKLAF